MSKVTFDVNTLETIIKRVCQCSGCVKCDNHCCEWSTKRCEDCMSYVCKKCIIRKLCHFCDTTNLYE